jgi:hypothetical protein
MLRSTKTLEPVANRLLAALPGKEYQRLRPHLEEVILAFGEVLYEPGEIIRRVYFPNHDVVSLLSMAEERSTLEVGVVGAEGMVGVSVFLGAQASPNQALAQSAGWAMSMEADAILTGMCIGHRMIEN